MEITSQTNLYGIIGFPVSHSLSPIIHNHAFQVCGVDSVYLAFPVKKLTLGMKKSLLELGVRGLSITVPHKKQAAALADFRDPLSVCCAASNTIRAQEGKWHSYNTDGKGALQSIHREFGSLEGKNILLIGYGGSASAIAHSILLDERARSLIVLGRNMNRKKKFIKQLQRKHPQK